MPSKKSALLILVGSAVALRFFTFFPRVIDHDESTYIVIASEMLQGELLYSDLIDIKPPGIFLLFALQLWLCKSIFFIRLAAAVVVGLTAYGLYRIKMQEQHGLSAGIAGGVLYLLLTGIYTNYGLAVNTELYFNFFTVWGLFWFQKGGVRDYGIGGLLMGFGFLVKYVVAFDFLLFMLWASVLLWVTTGYSFWNAAKAMAPRLLLAVMGLLCPFLCCYLYYQYIGHGADFYFITRVAPQNYVKSFQAGAMALLVGDFLLRFLPISLLATWAFIKTPRQRERYFFAGWFLFAVVAVVLPGNRFFHYTVQLMPPLAWLAANFFDLRLRQPKWFRHCIDRKKGYWALGLFAGALLCLHFKNFYLRPDPVRRVAQYLNAQLLPDESLYVGNSQQIYYFLTHKNCPTPYVHNTLLFDKQHLAVLHIDSTQHLRQIMEKHPSYVLQSGIMPSLYLRQYLEANYKLQTTMENVKIWHIQNPK